MGVRTLNPFLNSILPGLLISLAFTAVIGLTAASLAGFQIVGKTGIAFYLFGNLADVNEVIRIPIIDYAVIFLLYGIYLLLNWLINVFRRPTPAAGAATD